MGRVYGPSLGPKLAFPVMAQKKPAQAWHDLPPWPDDQGHMLFLKNPVHGGWIRVPRDQRDVVLKARAVRQEKIAPAIGKDRSHALRFQIAADINGRQHDAMGMPIDP